MPLTFYMLDAARNFPENAHSAAYLLYDNWDDYGFKTLFVMVVFDENGTRHDIGNIKIGFFGQDIGRTREVIPPVFNELEANFFSLGQDVDYYRNIIDKLTDGLVENLLVSLRDVTSNHDLLVAAENERCFDVSLLRNVSRTSIDNQFSRILRREAPLTEYNFCYEKSRNDRYSGITIDFTVQPNAKPSSNIHILIGRNGVGKTTLLNHMVDALIPGRSKIADTGRFFDRNDWRGNDKLSDDYFAGVVSLSFSAFDPFDPPPNQTDINAGMRYRYVGLKRHNDQPDQKDGDLKTQENLCDDFINSLALCFSLTAKRERWLRAVIKLESDINFAEMNLCRLFDVFNQDTTEKKKYFFDAAKSLYRRMSSGHAIVLLSITKLVEAVEEKTLVLLDEPESHLHPPLLSAFTRALSDLLVNRNGVAIIATHSPVVLQEVPRSCVSILRRTGLEGNVDKPPRETFAENVGILTRDVFGLEVIKSGFHDLLECSVTEGKTYEEIEREYQGQIGLEGKALLRSLVIARDSQVPNNQ